MLAATSQGAGSQDTHRTKSRFLVFSLISGVVVWRPEPLDPYVLPAGYDPVQGSTEHKIGLLSAGHVRGRAWCWTSGETAAGTAGFTQGACDALLF